MGSSPTTSTIEMAFVLNALKVIELNTGTRPLYHLTNKTIYTRSSVEQSNRLRTGVSGVRVSPGVPYAIVVKSGLRLWIANPASLVRIHPIAPYIPVAQ